MSDRLEEIKELRKDEWANDTGESEWWFAYVRDALDWLIAEVGRLRDIEEDIETVRSKLYSDLKTENTELKAKLKEQ